MKVVVDDRIAGKAAGRTRGLVVGQRVVDTLFVLELIPFADGGEEEVHCEQLEHMLVGGVEVVGVYEKDSKDAARSLLWKVLGKRFAKKTKTSGESAFVLGMLLGASAFKLVHFDLAAWSTKEQPVVFSTSNVLARMTLHSVKLSVCIGANAASNDGGAPGSSLERACEQFGELIRKEVIVGKLLKDKTSLWLKHSGPFTFMEPGSNLVLSGSVVGFAFVHADCPSAAAAALLLKDLSLSVQLRVGKMLDELDALQEESAAPNLEHALSRLKPSRIDKDMRWSTPRRLLIRGGAIPVCDWGFAWEPVDTWEETIGRCRQILGLETEAADVDASFESLKDGAFLELSGRKTTTTTKQVAKKQPEPVNKGSSQTLLILGVLLAIVIATLVWRLL